MYQSMAVVSDFDGTITYDDFFNCVVQRYLSPEALKPWQQYQDGKISHFSALQKIFAQIRADKTDFDEFIADIAIDNTFARLAEFCYVDNIPLYICSAGCEYYIRRILGKMIKLWHIRIISNYGYYTADKGLRIFPNRRYYDSDLGVSKRKMVASLQKRKLRVIYCGDGLPDMPAVKIADKVFAKGKLFELCRQNRVAVEYLSNFEIVQQWIKNNNEISVNDKSPDKYSLFAKNR